MGVPARGCCCCCCCCALGTGVDPRGGGGVRGEGVEAFVVFTDAEGGGRGERVRRVIGTVKVGEEDEESESESEDVEGWLADESERGSGGGVAVAAVPGGRGDDIVGVDALRWRRAGRSGAGVDVERGVLRPERVGSSGVRAGDEKSMLPSTESGGAGVLRADRGAMSDPLEVGRDAFGAGARIGTCGATVSRGFGTRSASRTKRKSSPNS